MQSLSESEAISLSAPFPYALVTSLDEMHKEFVVNYPCLDQAEAALICGTKSGRDGDKIWLAGLKLEDSKAVKVPTIEGVTVAFECKVVGTSGNPEKSRHLYISSKFKLFGMDRLNGG